MKQITMNYKLPHTDIVTSWSIKANMYYSSVSLIGNIAAYYFASSFYTDMVRNFAIINFNDVY